MKNSTEVTLSQVVARMDGTLAPHPAEPGWTEAYLPSPAVQNHAANLAFLPDGSLACVWFGGTLEGKGDICVWLSRLAPQSSRWSQPQRLSDNPDRSEQNPVLLTAPDGRVWLYHTSQPGGRQDACEIHARVSQDGGATFGPSARIGDFTGVFIRSPLQVTPTGRWLLPGFRCIAAPGTLWTGGLDTAVALYSADQGESWQAEEVPDSLGAVHMSPVAALHGRMPAFYRDRFAMAVQRSVSRDGGDSWAMTAPLDLPNNNSSIQAIRLQDGRIAMVLNPVNAAMSDARRASLYDEIDAGAVAGTGGAVWGVPRAPMAVAILDADGERVLSVTPIDTSSGACLTNNSQDGQNRELSYPSILQDPAGDLHVAYTCYRRAIKYVRMPLPVG